MKNNIKTLACYISLIIPKKNNQVVIYSPWKNGNTEIFFNYIADEHPNLIVKRFNKNNLIGFSLKNIKNLYFFYNSKFLITSHGVCKFKSCNQIHISLFHGLPIKKIGFIANEMKMGNFKSSFFDSNIDYHIVNSYISGAIFSSAWNLPERKMLYVGEPILDHLCKKSSEPPRAENEILYCPTWRKDSQYIDQFIEYAQNRPNIHWTISPHPADVEKFKEKLAKNSRLNYTLHETGSIEILPEFQHVYIDISSIFYYLLFLNTKITIFFPDQNKYLETFGCLYPFFEIYGLSQFKDVYTIEETHQKALRELFFANYSGNASQKIANFIVNYFK